MERRENRLIEDSSSNFACLCPRKRRLPRGKASTSPPPSSPLPIRNAPRSAIAGSLFAHPCRGLRLVWPTSSAFNERKNAPGLAIVQCDFLLEGFSFFFSLSKEEFLDVSSTRFYRCRGKISSLRIRLQKILKMKNREK